MKKTTEKTTRTKIEKRKRLQYLKYALTKRFTQVILIIMIVFGGFFTQLSYTHDVLEGTWQSSAGMMMIAAGVYMLYAVTEEYKFKNSRYKKKYKHLFKKRP